MSSRHSFIATKLAMSTSKAKLSGMIVTGGENALPDSHRNILELGSIKFLNCRVEGVESICITAWVRSSG